MIPREILNAQVVSLEDAHRELIRIASRALGLATELDLRDYFRLQPEASRAGIGELVNPVVPEE